MPEEHAELVGAGVRCIYFNQNAALDERVFDIAVPAQGPQPQRPFRAILNSACAPYKRLHLASQVDRLAVIGYVQDSDYHCASLPPAGATWLNLRGSGSGGSSSSAGLGPDGGMPGGPAGGSTSAGAAGSAPAPGSQPGIMPAAGTDGTATQVPAQLAYLSPAEVYAALNHSEVGALLSALEGPCWASTECLLCGLPVVSTRCSGGREVWYSQDNSIIVEPTPEAVAADGVRLSAEAWFAEHFRHKMGL
ncbi:hypothetical protein ABPG75_003415 [Micractinium tetrahymenae]